MRKLFFSMTAAAAFLLTIGGTVAAKAVQADTIWVYKNGDLTNAPDCDDTLTVVCAIEYHKLPNGQPDFNNPTGEEKVGIRQSR